VPIGGNGLTSQWAYRTEFEFFFPKGQGFFGLSVPPPYTPRDLGLTNPKKKFSSSVPVVRIDEDLFDRVLNRMWKKVGVTDVEGCGGL